MARLFKRSGEKKSLWQRIKEVAFTDVNVLMRGLDEGSLERLEELLLASDFGVDADAAPRRPRRGADAAAPR